MYIIIDQYLRYCIVYVDEKVLPFQGIIPQASVHVLSIPKFRDGLKQLGKVIFLSFFILFPYFYAPVIFRQVQHILLLFSVTGNVEVKSHLVLLLIKKIK